VEVDQHIENSRSSLSKDEFILYHNPVMKLQFFNEIIEFLAEIDQHIGNSRSGLSKHDFAYIQCCI